jgi:hypothetical protein
LKEVSASADCRHRRRSRTPLYEDFLQRNILPEPTDFDEFTHCVHIQSAKPGLSLRGGAYRFLTHNSLATSPVKYGDQLLSTQKKAVILLSFPS